MLFQPAVEPEVICPDEESRMVDVMRLAKDSGRIVVTDGLRILVVRVKPIGYRSIGGIIKARPSVPETHSSPEC